MSGLTILMEYFTIGGPIGPRYAHSTGLPPFEVDLYRVMNQFLQ